MDKDKLIARQSELIRIIGAIDDVLHARSWQVLRTEFEKREEVLNRQLLAEAKNNPVDVAKCYTLQGQLAEAKRSDLPNWAEKLKKELQGIKQKLHE